MIKARRLLCVVLLLGGVLLTGPGFATTTQAAPKQNALIIFSYQPTFPTSASILQALTSELADRDLAIDVEYMDSKRFRDDRGAELFRRNLAYKLEKLQGYDVIITVDDNALDFMLSHGEALLPDTPVVFFGVNDKEKVLRLVDNPRYTGLAEYTPISETISLARGLMPERDRLHIISDATVSGRGDLAKTLDLVPEFPDTNFILHSLEEIRWSQLSAELTALGENDSILLLSAYCDCDEAPSTFEESLELLKESTTAPIFHLWEHGIGDGALGGVIYDHRAHAVTAAQRARRVLNGENPADLGVVTQGPVHPLFDYHELQRFGIGMNQLPDNAEILNRPVSFIALALQLHRMEVLLLAFLFFSAIIATVYLKHQNQKILALNNKIEREARFRSLLIDSLPDLVWMKDPQGIYLAGNKRFSDFFGAPEHELLGKTDFDFVSESLANFFRENDQRAVNADKALTNEELVTFASDGHNELLETVKTPIYGDNGDLLGVLGVGRDVTERRQIEKRVRHLFQAVEQSPALIVITDTNAKIEYVNPAFEAVTGYSPDEVHGENPRILNAGQTPPEVYDDLWQTLLSGQPWEGEFYNRKKNGELYWERGNISPIFSPDGEVTHYLGIKQDITLQKQQEELLLRQARVDTLTELPNRLASLERLAQMIAHDQRRGGLTAVLFLDLDDFKKVNDTLGHETGDKLLIQAATRLRDGLRTEDTVGRLGGDEFIVLLGGLSLASDALTVASSIIKQFDTPFHIDDHELLLSISIGIAMHPDDGSDVSELLRKADAAMYHAKSNGRAEYALFTSQLNLSLQRRLSLEKHMIGALERGEFAVHYQPQIDLRTGRLAGAEALLRWNSPEMGNVPPSEFVPIAEHNGMIDALGLFVLDEALGQLHDWREQIDPELCIAVNLSPRQFKNHRLVAQIDAALAKADLPPRALELEITEGVLMLQHKSVEQSIRELAERGIALSLDDFGTGYSSLSYLRRYPFKELKIDRSFTSDMTDDPADRELVVAIIAMAQSLGLMIVAEGVETPEQEALLKQFGCTFGQGYLYSQAVPAADIPALSDQLRAGAAS